MGKVRTLVLIEDEPQQREVVQMMFEVEGYNVLSSNSAEEALKYIEQSEPDVVVTDVKLTGMDGFSLFDHVRNTLQKDRLPFVFITGYNHPETIEKMTKSQGTAYVTKPYEPIDLLITVDKLISSNTM